jgi:hypothetical protein
VDGATDGRGLSISHHGSVNQDDPGRAMIYVVVEELIPETMRGGTIDVATLGFISGFAVMMALDNGLR